MGVGGEERSGEQDCPLSGRRGWSWLGLRWRGGSFRQLLRSTLESWRSSLLLFRLDTRNSPIAKGTKNQTCYLLSTAVSFSTNPGTRGLIVWFVLPVALLSSLSTTGRIVS